jgi:hypothetical protein
VIEMLMTAAAVVVAANAVIAAFLIVRYVQELLRR